jgi:hypothetical protein
MVHVVDGSHSHLSFTHDSDLKYGEVTMVMAVFVAAMDVCTNEGYFIT